MRRVSSGDEGGGDIVRAVTTMGARYARRVPYIGRGLHLFRRPATPLYRRKSMCRALYGGVGRRWGVVWPAHTFPVFVSRPERNRRRMINAVFGKCKVNFYPSPTRSRMLVHQKWKLSYPIVFRAFFPLFFQVILFLFFHSRNVPRVPLWHSNRPLRYPLLMLPIVTFTVSYCML